MTFLLLMATSMGSRSIPDLSQVTSAARLKRYSHVTSEQVGVMLRAY